MATHPLKDGTLLEVKLYKGQVTVGTISDALVKAGLDECALKDDDPVRPFIVMSISVSRLLAAQKAEKKANMAEVVVEVGPMDDKRNVDDTLDNYRGWPRGVQYSHLKPVRIEGKSYNGWAGYTARIRFRGPRAEVEQARQELSRELALYTVSADRLRDHEPGPDMWRW